MDRAKIIFHRSHQPLTTAKKNSSVEEKKRQIFDVIIEKRFGMSITGPPKPIKDDGEGNTDDFIEYEDDDKEPRRVPDFEEMTDTTGRKFNKNPA